MADPASPEIDPSDSASPSQKVAARLAAWLWTQIKLDEIPPEVWSYVNDWVSQVPHDDINSLLKILDTDNAYGPPPRLDHPGGARSMENISSICEQCKRTLIPEEGRSIDLGLLEEVLSRDLPLKGLRDLLDEHQKHHLRNIVQIFEGCVPTPLGVVYVSTKGLKLESENVQYFVYLLQILWDICDRGLAFEAVRPCLVLPVCAKRIADPKFLECWTSILTKVYGQDFRVRRDLIPVASSSVRRSFVLRQLLANIPPQELTTLSIQEVFSSSQFEKVPVAFKKKIFDEVNPFGTHMSSPEWQTLCHLTSLFWTVHHGPSSMGTRLPNRERIDVPRWYDLSPRQTSAFEQMKSLFILNLLVHAMDKKESTLWKIAMESNDPSILPQEVQSLIKRLESSNQRRIKLEEKRKVYFDSISRKMEVVRAFRKSGENLQALSDSEKKKELHFFFANDLPANDLKGYLQLLKKWMMNLKGSLSNMPEADAIQKGIDLFTGLEVLKFNTSVEKQSEKWGAIGPLYAQFGDFTKFNDSMKALRCLKAEGTLCHNKANFEAFYLVKVILEELLKSPVVFKAAIDLQVVG